MSLKSQIGYKFTCDICAAKFETQLDLDTHLFNSSCERELKKQGETMTTPLKVTPACLRAKHRQGEYKRLARNLSDKKPKRKNMKATADIGARKLRLAVITNVYKQGHLTEAEAKELLNAPLNPDSKIVIDDSNLLGDPDGLEKIK